jgi:DNA-directed RNA polymerase specialized sigma24 family protein
MTAEGPAAFDPSSAEILARLPEPHREVLRLRHVDGCTLEQIAGRLGLTPVAIAALLLEAARMVESRSDEMTLQDPP